MYRSNDSELSLPKYMSKCVTLRGWQLDVETGRLWVAICHTARCQLRLVYKTRKVSTQAISHPMAGMRTIRL